MRNTIRKLVELIEPLDELEASHISQVIDWIDSGEELFRIVKPATPSKHLVSYFVLIDQVEKKMLLLNHIKSGLWLPAGGHVEKKEHPKTAVEREIQEELNLSAVFIKHDPFFLTQTITVGETAGHTDVSLWYVLEADSSKEVDCNPEEFLGYKWFGFKDILCADASMLDPHMQRFVKKFERQLG